MLWKGAVFMWTEQCGNAFKLLKSELVKMPMLQYLNPNRPFRLFIDASKHSYLDILHQKETPGKPGAEVNLIPIAYFSGSFSRTQQLWNTTQKKCYVLYLSIKKFAFYLAGAKCKLYCDHKPLAPFFTTGRSSSVLNRWALELQQFNIKLEHIHGKKNIVTNTVSGLWMLGLYKDNDNDDVLITTIDIINNIIEEVLSTDIVPRTPA